MIFFWRLGDFVEENKAQICFIYLFHGSLIREEVPICLVKQPKVSNTPVMGSSNLFLPSMRPLQSDYPDLV